MNPRTLLARLALAAAALALPALLAPAPALAAEDGPDWAGLLEKRAPAVVSIKFVAKMHLSLGGQAEDRESNGEIRGVVVDPSGLVMASNDALEGPGAMLRQMMRRRGGMGGGGPHAVTVVPSDLKVLFGTESKEYPAVLVARDTNLGLAFLQVVDLEGRKPDVVDLSKAADVKVGSTLAVVSRRSRGFDCAPIVSRLFVNGKVERPRGLWSITGEVTPGLPAYDLQGVVAGVLTRQAASGGVDDPSMEDQGVFLLPLEPVRKAVEQAKSRAPEALAKAKEAPADAGMGEPAPPAPEAPESPKAPEQPK